MSRIITHRNMWHTDEIYGCATIRGLEPEIEIVRVADIGNIQVLPDDYVLDIGRVYDQEKNRFDHHQGDFHKTHQRSRVRFATAGLVWLKFGETYCKSVLQKTTVQLDSEWLNIPDLAKHIMNRMFSFIDADDNGDLKTGVSCLAQNGKKLYPPTIVDHIKWLYRHERYWRWDDKETSLQFEKAVSHAGEILTGLVCDRLRTQEAPQIVHNSTIDGAILILEANCPWVNIVANNSKFKEIRFVVFPVDDDTWRVQAIRPSKHSGYKQLLPSTWAGQQEEFATTVGVDGAIFCHKNLHICGAQQRKQAVQLAKLALT